MQRSSCLGLASGCFVGLGVLAWAVNYWTTEFPPASSAFVSFLIMIAVLLSLIAYGLQAAVGRHFTVARMLQEVACCLGVLSLLGLVANMVEYTPFSPIDALLVKADARLHVSVGAGMAWVQVHPFIKECLWWSYNTLDIAMLIGVLALIISRRYTFLYEYYTLLFISACIGYTIYYFFPTTAPASILSSPYFVPEQYATGLKFSQIHHHQLPTTAAGGLISFPSFHVIWAWCLVYAVRCWPILLIVFSFYGMILTLACVLLGWHYWVDIIGSVCVLVMAHGLERYFIHGKPTIFRGKHRSCSDD